jgi:hypothetical protein
MKKILLFLFFGFNLITSFAQDDTTVNLEVLKAPVSPAFNLLGIAPSSIERPTDITAFMASVQSNTGNFTSFPKNYAVEVAPFLLARKTGPTLNEYQYNNFWKHLLPQTFQLSLGVSQQNADGEISDETDAFPRGALGFRVALVRQPWTDQTRRNYDTLHAAQVRLLDKTQEDNLTAELSVLEADRNDKLVQMQIIGKSNLSNEAKRELLTPIVAQLNIIKDSIAKKKAALANDLDAAGKLKELATSFEINRKEGFYLDLEAGMVMDFPDRRFNYSTVSKAGVWLTGGYDGHEQLLSVLGIARYLYQPDKIFADESGQLETDDISTFDFGARLLLNTFKGKFNASSEFIYRSVVGNDIIDPNWRIVLNLEYSVGPNQKLTFGFGKNFDGTITKDGNLIAALNFIAGFGNKRKVE